MASGFSRKKRGDDEYVFIDGVAMRAEEAVRIDSRDTMAPGQAEAGASPADAAVAAASAAATKKRSAASKKAAAKGGKMSDALKDMGESDALELSPEVLEGNLDLQTTRTLLVDERKKVRAKYIVWGIVLVLLVLGSLCLSSQHSGLVKSPLDVAANIGRMMQLGFIYVFQNSSYHTEYLNTTVADPLYADTVLQVQMVFKYVACGALLALSGMLYQNAFKNPIAAPSMLGVTNGINAALLILVLQFGYESFSHIGLYYIYSVVGGILVLLLVMAGGKWISGKGRFNAVNMILMGTIISQLLNVIILYVQANFMDDKMWGDYYLLTNATNAIGPWMFGTLIIGGIAALVPVVLFRFKLNLISFSDEETRLLGVNPTKLRIVALACGSLMILVAQLNAGQVAMVSLVVPFLVRALFGSEFRKQLGGNLLMGAIVLLICGDLSTTILFDGLAVGLAPVVSILVLPLFVWIMALQQRSWD